MIYQRLAQLPASLSQVFGQAALLYQMWFVNTLLPINVHRGLSMLAVASDGIYKK